MSKRLEPILLRVGEAADFLGISRTKCYQMLQRGELPVVRLGGSVRVHRALLEELVTEAAEAA